MTKIRSLLLGMLVSTATTLSAVAQTPAQSPDAGAATSPPATKQKSGNTRRTAANPGKRIKETPADMVKREQLQREEQRLATERRALESLRETTLALVKLMVREGVIQKDQAAALLPEPDRTALDSVEAKVRAPIPVPPVVSESPKPAEESSATSSEPPPGDGTGRKRSRQVRVPYVPEVVKDEIREQIKQEVLAQAKSERWGEPNTLPEWMDRISFEGDIRVRYEGLYFSDLNGGALAYNLIEGADLRNTDRDEGRMRLRARVGVNVRISESLGGGIRIVTGSSEDPVSENISLGRSGRYVPVQLDRGFIKWDPNERWSFIGGRMANPWFWPTDLIWDEDLGFDGVVGSFKPTITSSTSMFVTAGVFPLETATPTLATRSPRTKYLYGVQGGALWEPSSSARLRVAAAIFDFRNVEGVPNRNPANTAENNWTAPQFRQKGNSIVDLRFDQSTVPGFADYGLASKFRVLNVSAELSLAQLDPLFVTIAGDFANNLGFDQAEIFSRTGLRVPGENQAYQTRLTMGSEFIRQARDWQVFGGYRHVERNAVVDAFTDSDFGLGGTNSRGYFVGLSYGLDRNVWTRVRWLSSNQITGLPLAVDTMQADLNLRF